MHSDNTAERKNACRRDQAASNDQAHRARIGAARLSAISMKQIDEIIFRLVGLRHGAKSTAVALSIVK
jgi:hypothetical protein